MMPISWGLLYSVPVILSWEWFPERKGLISGLIIGAHGFASFISSFIAQAIVNPNNLMPDKITKLFPKEVTDNVPGMFNTQLIMYAALCLISIAMCSRNPEFAIR